jgi:putative membrane protein
VLVVMASSVLYETIEWLAAVVFGGELGVRYLGTQGDEWDGNKDMTLAAVGALVAMAAVLAVNARTQPGFSSEWRASFSARDSEPLGERALRRRFVNRI